MLNSNEAMVTKPMKIYNPGVIRKTVFGKIPLSTKALVDEPKKINGINENIIEIGSIFIFLNILIIAKMKATRINV